MLGGVAVWYVDDATTRSRRRSRCSGGGMVDG